MDFYYHLQIKALLFFKPTILFDKINHLPWYKDTLNTWVNDLQLAVNTKILEAGCSTGLLTNNLFQQGFSVVGADKSTNMITKAQNNFPSLNFREENIFGLSFVDNHFDAVIAASLLNIVPNKEKAMQEMARVCKSGGKVSIFTPIQGFTPQHLEQLILDLKVTKFSKAALQAWYRLPPKMDAQTISDLFEQAGLSKPAQVNYLSGMVAGFTATKL